MAKITRDEIINACVDGIKYSFKEYLKWSSNEYLWNAPEYLLTVNIAKKLSEIENNNKFITLEDNLRKTLNTANAQIKGQIEKKARANGRSDIVFWWGKGTPRGIIEVKNAVFQKKDIQEDLDRIYAILKKDSDIEFGISTFYIDRHYERGNASEKIEKRIEEEFIEKIKEELYERNLKIRYDYLNILDEETDAGFVVAIMIHK